MSNLGIYRASVTPGQMVKVRAAETTLVKLSASVIAAVTWCLPLASVGLVKVHLPDASAVVVPMMTVPSRIVTTAPAAAVPVKVGVLLVKTRPRRLEMRLPVARAKVGAGAWELLPRGPSLRRSEPGKQPKGC